MSPLPASASWLLWVLTLPGVAHTPAIQVESSAAGTVHQAAQAPAPQPDTKTKASRREFFFSWGYNTDAYTRSDLPISQPSLGNDFTFVGVRARDSKGWTELFSHAPTVPQYNVRLGVFFNDKWGVELALDHIKWIVIEAQDVRLVGTLNGSTVDTQIVLSKDVLQYKLNNGANPIFFNVVRRFVLAGEPPTTGHLAVLLKAGVGFAVPHTENTLFGQPNDAGFQPFHGWDLDAGAAVRGHLWRGLYLELEDKFLYARYFGVKVDAGTASQSVKANEFSFSFGFAFK